MNFTPRTYSHEHPDHGSFFITHFEGKYCASRIYGPGRRCELITADAPTFSDAQRACLERCTELDAQEGVGHAAAAL